MSYVLLLSFLLAGFLAGRWITRRKGRADAATEAKPPKAIGIAMNVCLFSIVTLLGFEIGSDGTLLAQAGVIGLKALTLAAGAVAGSVALVALYVALRRERGR